MRTLFDFHGGIHPPESKAVSLQRPIRFAGLPDQLIIPLHQHIGAPAITQVEVGQTVLKGDLLADAQGTLSVPVHASTSGTVTAIELHGVPHPSGMTDWCVIIEPDGKDQWRERVPCDEFRALGRDGLLEKIRQSGIAGLGGAGFPTDIKLRPPKPDKVQTLILNGAECEPYITADQSLMQERATEIIAGLEIMAFILCPAECLIGIEDNKPEAIAALRQAAAETSIEVVVIPTKYPSGGEKQLIRILTGMEVPHGGIPADIGIMCQNVGTAAAVYRAIIHDEPLVSRITTLTGEALSQPGNFDVLIGTPIRHLLDQAGQNPAVTERLIMGGPMMGFSLLSDQVPVIKTTNCIIAATPEEFPPPPPAQACIRCGMCEQVCPMDLLPQQLYWFSRAREYDKAEQANLFDCIECGACSYVCPSTIPLVQYYRHAKGEIREHRAEQAKSDRARERFEQRQARLEREKAEKEARRKARAEAAAKAKKEKQAAPDTPPAKPAPATTEDTGPDRATLLQRRDQALKKLDQVRERLDEAKANAPETVPQLERALAKNEKRLATAEEALAAVSTSEEER